LSLQKFFRLSCSHSLDSYPVPCARTKATSASISVFHGHPAIFIYGYGDRLNHLDWVFVQGFIDAMDFNF
ncbi:MAG: hypothetical protein NXI02_30545, partial [Rhodobacteraceae bacterium]|nr:hypothetical protein [Paracoccaceae bacterium]